MRASISIWTSKCLIPVKFFGLRHLSAAIFVILALGSTGCRRQPTLLELSSQQKQELENCRSELQSRIHAGTLNDIVDQDGACFDRLDRQEALSSSLIRKNAYLIQQSQTRVLMWMVVGITFAGVLLAALQLIAGFRLALLGKATFDGSQGGTINIEAKKLSITSSVSGILVLAISLCFFYVFTQNIYLIRDSIADRVSRDSIRPPSHASGEASGASSEQLVPVAPEIEEEADRELRTH